MASLDWLENASLTDVFNLSNIIDSQIQISPFRHLNPTDTSISSFLTKVATNEYISKLEHSKTNDTNDILELNNKVDKHTHQNQSNSNSNSNVIKSGSKCKSIASSIDSDMSAMTRNNIDLINLHCECIELFDIFDSSMKHESNASVLLIGSHGFGKSSVLYKTFEKLKLKYGDSSFVTVYLNPYLLLNDVNALFQLVTQLSNQNVISKYDWILQQEEKAQQQQQQQSQCSIFSHNSNESNITTDYDINTVNVDNTNQIGKKTAFVENLDYLIGELKKISLDNVDNKKKNKNKNKNSKNNNSNDNNNNNNNVNNKKQLKPIFVILDYFELFAHRNKQTLLYNLFDLIATENSLFNLIGLTNINNIDEFLEKRIRSRFVNKKIFIPQTSYFETSSNNNNTSSTNMRSKAKARGSAPTSKVLLKLMFNSLLIVDDNEDNSDNGNDENENSSSDSDSSDSSESSDENDESDSKSESEESDSDIADYDMNGEKRSVRIRGLKTQEQQKQKENQEKNKIAKAKKKKIENLNQLVQSYNNWMELNIFNNKEFENYISRHCQCGISPNRLLTICAVIKCNIFHFFINYLQNKNKNTNTNAKSNKNESKRCRNTRSNARKNANLLKQQQKLVIGKLIDSIDESLFCNPIYLMIKDLSINEMIIFIIALKFQAFNNISSFNFEMIYKKLLDFNNGNGSIGSNTANKKNKKNSNKKKNSYNNDNDNSNDTFESESIFLGNAMMHTNSKLVYLKAFESLINNSLFISANRNTRGSLYCKNIFSNVNYTQVKNLQKLSHSNNNNRGGNRLLINHGGIGGSSTNYSNYNDLFGKVGISNCSNDCNDVIYDFPFEQVRLNDQIMFEGGKTVLDFIKTKVHHCPTWIKQWLLRDSTNIQM